MARLLAPAWPLIMPFVARWSLILSRISFTLSLSFGESAVGIAEKETGATDAEIVWALSAKTEALEAEARAGLARAVGVELLVAFLLMIS